MLSGHPLKKAVILLNCEKEARGLANNLTELKPFSEITVASSFDNFITLIQSEQVDCFFLDAHYEQFPTIDLVKQLRKGNRYSKTPLVLLSNKNDDHIQLRYSSLDVDVFTSLPFVLEDFKAQLDSALTKRFSNVIPEHYNVLVLDNNKYILEIMKLHLNRLKHTNFQTCESISEARSYIDKTDFDLLLLDWSLYDGTCIDLIEYIRSKKENIRLNNALIMVITGRSEVDDVLSLLKYNVKDYLTKPFDYNEFVEKLQYAMKRHQARPKLAKA